MKDIEQAEEHWKWLEPLLHYLYVTAWVHGAKHEGDEWEVKPNV